jgi:hypothetical protein
MNLGGNAVDLLLAIAETPDMAISAVALRDYDGGVGSLLVDAGALTPDGFEPVAASQADHDDAVVSLIWNGEKGGYAYFSPAVGLVRVDDDALVRFRLDVSWFLGWIAGQLGFGTNASQVNLVPGQLWDFGDTWLGERKSARRKTAIYVARPAEACVDL